MSAAPVRGALDVRGLELAYHRWGPADGEPVLCLHGFMDHGRAFAFVAEAMPAGYQLVAPDMRGHGESGWIGSGGYYHFYDYFDDMARLVEHLGWAEFGVVAHSMGGSVASGLIAMMPERVHALVTLEGMGPPFTEQRELPDRLKRWAFMLGKGSCNGDVAHRRAARRKMPDLGHAKARLMNANPRLGDARAARLADSFTEPADDGEGVVWRQDPLHRTPSAKPYLRGEAESLWARITCPVLSLQGSDSFWQLDDLPARHAALADVTVAQVPEAGHNLHHDQPELLARAIDAWMRGARDDLPPALEVTD